MTRICCSFSMVHFKAYLKVIKGFSFFLKHMSDSWILGIDTDLCALLNISGKTALLLSKEKTVLQIFPHKPVLQGLS